VTDVSPAFDASYTLDDKYTREAGRIYLTGVQALVRLPLMQRRRDVASGLDTAGFISGYRGSPLGTYDLALWQAQPLLAAHRVHFEPGVNEDLAATAVWGSQLVNNLAGARYDGVFGIWYGKGPGVDRSCDALKHGNYAGASPHGGVLVLTGDDPGARSSSIAHQSEHALIHLGTPILNPSNVQDYLDFGLLGFAMSRYSGCWGSPTLSRCPRRCAPEPRSRPRTRCTTTACPPPRPSRARTGSTAWHSTRHAVDSAS
jgi:indolepyruvate ferredoxin oxidoreductase